MNNGTMYREIAERLISQAIDRGSTQENINEMVSDVEKEIRTLASNESCTFGGQKTFLYDILCKLNSKKYYKVCMMCFDSVDGTKPYEDVPAVSPIFESKKDAFAYARYLAEQECDGLNGADGVTPDKGVSFGIPEDEQYQNGETVRVNQYCSSENDDTGETNPVTIYFIVNP